MIEDNPCIANLGIRLVSSDQVERQMELRLTSISSTWVTVLRKGFSLIQKEPAKLHPISEALRSALPVFCWVGAV